MDNKLKKHRSLYIPYAGPVLLEFPLLNKGSAFSMEERSSFNLLGLLPEVVETIEEQAERAWIQYQGFKTEIDKHIYLRNIQDTNETLFYRLVQNHLEEMMPVIYTPTVGAACERFSELGVCHRLNQLIRGQLFVGNSMPARLMDMLGEAGKGPSRVMTNRGASGIDGLIATAYGFAQSVQPGSNEPTTLLLGDLSALHDLNSLALLGKSSRPLVVILLNNDGGSIFRMLPVPTQDALLETYYCLPHGLHFEHAAAMFGLHYRAPTTLADFERDYAAALEKGVTLIEIKVPSSEVAEDLKALGSAIRGS